MPSKSTEQIADRRMNLTTPYTYNLNAHLFRHLDSVYVENTATCRKLYYMELN
jgi:hypothetical protein